MRRRTSATTFL